MIPKMIVLIVIGLVAAACGFADETGIWKTSEGNFSAQIQLSPTSLSLDQLLKVQIKLTYPSAYQPNIGAIRKELLSYGGFDKPPFTMVKEIIRKPAAQPEEGILSQQLTFILSPQLPGQHFLTFPKIAFASQQGDKDQMKALVGEVFEISVTPAAVDFQAQTLAAPLMPLSQQLPITSLSATSKNIAIIKKPSAAATAHNLAVIKSRHLPWLFLWPAVGPSSLLCCCV